MQAWWCGFIMYKLRHLHTLLERLWVMKHPRSLGRKLARHAADEVL